MPDVISNTSPLYYLHRIEQLSILRELYGHVWVTPQVVEELRAGADQGLSVPEVNRIEWIKVRAVTVPRMLELISDLGKGEASILALAMEIENPLLIVDDALGRRIASAQAIALTGTVGVLIKAKQVGILSAVASQLDRLKTAGFYLHDAVYQKALCLAGEK